MKKVIATILSVATLCTVLAGCGKAVTTSVSNTPEATTSVPVSTPAVSTSEEAGPVAAYTTSLEDIKAKGELVIGLDDTFAPMGFRDEAGNLVGFDIELATAVCQELGVKAKFQTIDWDAKELELTSGNIDCIWNGMSITDERQQSMSLSQPYLNNIICVMTTDKVEVRAFTDLNGLNIGIQAGSAALEAVQGSSIYDSIKEGITEYPTYDEAILDMQAGRLDCLIIDEVYGSYKNAKMNNIFMPSRIDFGDDLYAIGFRKSDSELCNSVNDAINKLIANGKAAEISTKWFGKDIVVKP